MEMHACCTISYSSSQFSTGKCYCVDVELSDTIENVNAKILNVEGWPVDRQCLIWRSIILEDLRSLWTGLLLHPTALHPHQLPYFKRTGRKTTPSTQDHLNDMTFIRDALLIINSQLADRRSGFSHIGAVSFRICICHIIKQPAEPDMRYFAPRLAISYSGHILPKVWKYCKPVTSVVVWRSKLVSHKDVLCWAAICDPSNMAKTFTLLEIVVITVATWSFGMQTRRLKEIQK